MNDVEGVVHVRRNLLTTFYNTKNLTARPPTFYNTNPASYVGIPISHTTQATFLFEYAVHVTLFTCYEGLYIAPDRII